MSVTDVLRWADAAYLQVLAADIDQAVRAEPFEGIEPSLAEVFGKTG